MVNALTGLNDFKTEIDYLNVYYKWKTIPKDLKKSSDAVDKRVAKKCV